MSMYLSLFTQSGSVFLDTKTNTTTRIGTLINMISASDQSLIKAKTVPPINITGTVTILLIAVLAIIVTIHISSVDLVSNEDCPILFIVSYDNVFAF